MIHLDQIQSEKTTRPFDLSDRGLSLADGVFDTSMVLGGRVVFRKPHFTRLQSDAQAMGISIDASRIDEAADAILSGATGSGVLRITVTRGPAGRGLAPPADPAPTLLANLATFDVSRVFNPVRLAVAVIRRNATSPTSRHKTLAYLDAVLAARDAASAGFDDALFLNHGDRIACAGAGNVFAVFGDEVVTPPVADGVLPGIIRARILDAGMATERGLTLPDLEKADGLFVTNSLRLIAPVTALDTKVFGPLPPIVGRLMADVANQVAADAGVAPFDIPEIVTR